jgi:hypothetical protein
MKRIEWLGLVLAGVSGFFWHLARSVHELQRCLRRAANVGCDVGGVEVEQAVSCSDFPSTQLGRELAWCNDQTEMFAPIFRIWGLLVLLALGWSLVLWFRGRRKLAAATFAACLCVVFAALSFM